LIRIGNGTAILLHFRVSRSQGHGSWLELVQPLHSVLRGFYWSLFGTSITLEFIHIFGIGGIASANWKIGLGVSSHWSKSIGSEAGNLGCGDIGLSDIRQ